MLVREVRVSGETVGNPVLFSREPLGVQTGTGIEDKTCQVAGRFELERVTVVGEIRLPEPAGRRGAVSLGQDAGPVRDVAGKDLESDRDDAPQELEQVQGDSGSATHATVRRDFEGVGSSAARAETTNAVLGRVGP